MRDLGFWGVRLGVVACAVWAGGAHAQTGTPPRLSPAVGLPYAGRCDMLMTTLAGMYQTQLTAAETVPAATLAVGGQPVPEHCRVTGKMHERVSPVDGKTYAIGFELRLPKQWNGRFLYQGNGGIDGVVQPALGGFGGGPVTHALQQGFAVLSSDAGHSGAKPDFGVDPQARLDYGYQAVAKLTPMAKSAIRATYGKGPDRSYFAGCSNGGRHALVAASRYFKDYDGILAGAPGYNLPKAAVANLAAARLYQTVATVPVTDHITLATAVTDAERQVVATAVTQKCDALDGVKDGMVQDVAACQATFNLKTDVPTCTGERNGTCLTPAQKDVLSQVFRGTTNSKGVPFYTSFPYDPGFGAGRSGVTSGGSPVGSGIAFWEYFASTNLDSGSTGIVFQVPPVSPAGFNPLNFSLTTDLDQLHANVFATNSVYAESSMSFMTPPNPTRMQGLRDRGGKIMVYHGVSDSIFSAHDTQAWFEGVSQNTGNDFARFYPVPGMGHCSGGPATDQFDMLTPLVKWVEQGVQPQAVVAQARGAGNAGGTNADLPSAWAADRTRPLCPFPQVARYKGTGSIESADNFMCQ